MWNFFLMVDEYLVGFLILLVSLFFILVGLLFSLGALPRYLRIRSM